MARPLSLTAGNSAHLDTAIKQFGTASVDIERSTNDYVSVDNSGGELTFGTGDFTIEFWFRTESLPGSGNYHFLYDARSTGTGTQPSIILNNQRIKYYTAGAFRINGTTVLSNNTWYHAALVKSSGTTTLYLDGSSEGTYSDSNNYSSRSDPRIGGNFNSVNSHDGYIDEFRVSTTARYTSSFTPSTSAFENDSDTQLLVHFDGTDGSTTFEDDNSTTGVTHEGAASLSASASVSATAGKIHSASIALSGAFTPSITAVASLNGSIDVAAQFTQSSDAERTRSSDVTLSTIINLSLQGDRIRSGESTLSASATLTTTADRTRSTDSSLAVSVSLSTTATRIKPLDADLDGVFTPSITAVASLNGSSDFAAQASLSATATRIHPGAASLAGAFTATTNGGLLLEDSASLSSSASLSANAIEYIITKNFGRPYPLQDDPLSTDLWSFDSNDRSGEPYSGSLNILDGNTLQLANNDYAIGTYGETRTQSLNVGSGDDFVFETWIKISGTGPSNATSERTFIRMSPIFYFALEDLLTPTIDYYLNTNSTSTSWTLKKTVSLTKGSWVHLSVQRSGSTITYKTNGNTQDTTTYSGAFNTNVDTALEIFAPIDEFDSANIDSMAFRIGDDTVTALASPYQPTNDAEFNRFVYKFDSSAELFTDYTVGTYEYAAGLLAEATVTASLGGTFGTSANISAAASLSADADKIKGAIANISSAASLSATIGVKQSAESDLNAIFSQTSTVGAIRQGGTSLQASFAQNADINVIAGADSSISASATLSATSTRIKQLSSDIDAFVSTLVAAAKVGRTLVSLDNTATLSATPNFTASSDVFAYANASVDEVVAIRVHPGAADLDSAATQTAEVNLTAGAGADLGTSATVTANVDRLRTGSVAIDATATLSADGNVFFGQQADLDTAATITATGLRIRFAESDLAVAATQSADGIKAVKAEAAISGAFAATLTARLTATGDIDLDTQATLSATPVKTASTPVELTAAASASADPTAQFDTSSALSAEFALQGSGGGLTGGIFDISVTATVTATGGTIQLEKYVYTIPSETRSFTIDSELRTHTVHKENRTYTLGEL